MALRRQRMTRRTRAVVLAIGLGAFPAAAQAQQVPVWLVVAGLSPFLVLALCVVLGCVTRSPRTGVMHAGLALLWVVLFSLAAYFVENDHVIWAPLVFYALHAALVLVLIVAAVARTIARRSTARRS